MMTVETKPIIEISTLLESANRNFGVLMRQIGDLTHEESLLQLPFRGNCLNWIVGHLTQSRNKMLQIVNIGPIWTSEQIDRYERNSEPITSGEDAIHFDQMREDFKTIHQHLIARLSEMTMDDLAVPAPQVIKNIPDWNIAEFLNFLLWHETYHVGQTEMLRQLAGKNDKVI